MSRNDAQDFAQRLYARIPAHYRIYDAERGRPLFALLKVVGEQVANVRQDLDSLWDNFFIETCDDWVTPYIGALVGANLLQQPVGQSNRLDVWNTVIWRRSKGTPQMLEALATSITGWPADLAEFFHSMGWSQNMNHVRLDRPLTPHLRDASNLRLLGQAADPFGHAADFRPAGSLAQGRTMRTSPGQGIAAFGSPGRYQIKNIGIFVRRLRTFAVAGATPAAALPGAAPAAGASLFTFNPLFRDTPLFAADSGVAFTRAGFAANPWGAGAGVRQFGVLLATDSAPAPADAPSSQTPYTFGGVPSISLDPAAGMRLLDPRSFQLGSDHFLITAQWRLANATSASLGVVSTLFAASGKPSFTPGVAASGAGQLVITIQPGRAGAGWPGPLIASHAARFPGAIVVVRAARSGALHASDALYVYLPPAFLRARDALTYFIADDGSSYTSPTFTTASLARASEGQIYPARVSSASTIPAGTFTALNRKPGGMVLPDRARFGGAGVLVEAALFTGPSTFQTLGAIATVNQPAAGFSDLQAPNPWPAFTYAPSVDAVNGRVPSQGIVSILLRALTGNFIPAAELVIVNRAGRSLLVYLPEISAPPAEGVRLLVADDGGTWFAPVSASVQANVLQQQTFNGLSLARAALGQTLPIPGLWPLQQRIPVAANLCRSERTALLSIGELGIDPELGRFALPPADPSLAQGNFSVDYVEAFSGAIGANSGRQLASSKPATRLVSKSGDADTALSGAPVHTSLADAVAAARDGDVIEIADSATYSAASGITLKNAAIKDLTIRAALGERPCLTFYSAANTPADVSLLVTSPLSSLALDGLLISGGPIFIESRVGQFTLTSCTLDPLAARNASLVAIDTDPNGAAAYFLSRSITGALRTGPGVDQLTVSDSIIDQKNGPAIAGLTGFAASPPVLLTLKTDAAAKAVQLERVTVFGRIACEVLRASECLFDDLALVQDQQSGCVRFTRFEAGSVLPRRYQSIPNDAQMQACKRSPRCLAPAFNSRVFGRPGYAQLGSACANEILKASENGAEVGAFAADENTIRLGNLRTKLRENMPVGLSAVVIAET